MDNNNVNKSLKASYLDEFDQSASENDDDNNDDDDEDIYGWDLFRSFPSKINTGSASDNTFYVLTFQLIKFITYLIMFILVLGSGIISKCTIIFMTSQIGRKEPLSYCEYNEPEERRGIRKLIAIVPDIGRITWYWCIIIAFSIPELIALINSIHYILFRKIKYPNIIDIIIVCIIDFIHVISISILFLVVIPQYNSIEAVTIASSTLFIPSILGILMRNRNVYESSIKYIIMIIGDVTILLFQIIIICLFSLLSNNIDDKSRWLLPIVLILSSCRWWPNYVSSKSHIGFIRYLSRIKDRLELSRGIYQGISSLWRILIIILSSIVIVYCQGIDIDQYFNCFPGNIIYNITLNDINDELDINDRQIAFLTINSSVLINVLLINATSSFLLYLASKFSNQTLMQRYGFALPNTLIVPSTIIVIFILSISRWRDVCALHNFIPDYLFFYSPNNIVDINDELSKWQYWIWLLELLSQLWTTIHVWMPHYERLATADRIYSVTSYDSLIVDQSLMLNRRKEDKLNDINDMNFESIGRVITGNDNNSKNLPNTIRWSDRVTKIYACATMWHELQEEMVLFINSILRLDLCQSAMKFIYKRYNIKVDDYFELETHIFFDDAFECMHGCEGSCDHHENETHVNDYVKSLIDTMKSSVKRMGMLSTPPMKYPTPYGGRLEWLLPGKTRLIVHLKDKNKIRHRKRWSQVMYMYYLLGYRLIDQPIHINRKATIAENTYILTLDGDIDFRPTAVKVLLHLMKRDKELGAACGRIHPIGSGPIVWFQKFEYAIGHWLQKSTEHTLGSVLCSPGCFSLFRAKALMEDNVMRKYATRSSAARDYIQYDQGEDRWLCTLILQSGYRVEYSAASDSYTHAPETFNEFYNQRRRWIPSTIANIFDLLNTSKETRKVNENISWLYMAYQWALMGSTILGPGTIFLMLVGALVAAFGNIDNWTSLYFNLIPIAIFVIVCIMCKPKTQLMVAGIVSGFYGLIMIVVLVGIMLQIAEDGWVAPTTILLVVVAVQIIIAGLLHPQEWSCLLCGVIYYVTVPSMYMILIIYSLFNVHDVTWGTRESKVAFVDKVGFEMEDDDLIDTSNNRGVNNNNTKGSIDFSLAGLFRCMLCTQNQQSDELSKLEMIAHSLNEISSRLEALEKDPDINKTPQLNNSNNDELIDQLIDDRRDDAYNEVNNTNFNINSHRSSVHDALNDIQLDNFLVNPSWIHDPDIRKGGTEFLSHDEELFWKNLIKKYLYPLDMDKKKVEKMEEALKKLRNDNIFKFFMVNSLFVLTVLLMQLNKETLHFEWPLGKIYNITYYADRKEVHLDKDYLELEPIGCLFIGGFLAILCIQFVAMLFHRYNTFLHLLSNTSLVFKFCEKPENISEDKLLENHAKDIVDGLQRLAEDNGIPDSKYLQSNTILSPNKRNTVHALIENNSKKLRAPTNFDAVFRENLTKASGNTRLTSTGISQNMVKALDNRRTTLVAKQRDIKLQKNDSIIINDNGNNENDNVNKSNDGQNVYTYDNGGYVDEMDNNDRPNSHNQVKFSKISENV